VKISRAAMTAQATKATKAPPKGKKNNILSIIQAPVTQNWRFLYTLLL
jgi:hypothetical protein